MPQKLFSSEVLQKLIRLCQEQGLITAVDHKINNVTSPHYNYGPVGAMLRSNFIKEWWKEILNQGDIYQVTSPVYSHSTRQVNGGMKNYWLEKDHYQSVLAMVRRSLPFGVASQVSVYTDGDQIGGRTHVSSVSVHSMKHPNSTEESTSSMTSDQFIYRCSNQEELLFHYYCPAKLSTQVMDRWRQQRLRWWKKFARTPSLYSAVDGSTIEGNHQVGIQFPFPWGPDNVEVITNCGSEYLTQQQEASGVSNMGFWNNRSCVPDVIQSRCVVEHGLLACLLDAFSERTHTQPPESKIFMQFHISLAPYKVALSTDGSHPSMDKICDHVTSELRRFGIPVYSVIDHTSSLEQQLTRFDQFGIPWCILLGKETITKGIAKLRNRDTMLWEDVNVLKLAEKIQAYLSFSQSQ